MRQEILGDPESVAVRASELVARRARAALGERGRFLFAVSGGRTPWTMLGALAREPLPWSRIHLFQVDERVAPAGDPERNWTHIESCLLRHVALPPDAIHPMPVADADREASATRYARELRAIAGSPPVLDLVHLGLGEDGHTASLVPGDPVLDIADADVAMTGPYQGHPRMTLTLPVLDRARCILWLVTGASKAAMLRRLLAADRDIPAGRVRQDSAWLLADAAAANRTPARDPLGRGSTSPGS